VEEGGSATLIASLETLSHDVSIGGFFCILWEMWTVRSSLSCLVSMLWRFQHHHRAWEWLQGFNACVRFYCGSCATLETV